MQRYGNSIIDVLVDRTADELIGALLVALVLSLALAGMFALLRRKISDATTLITCLALAANLVGMVLAAGFVRSRGREPLRSGREVRSRPLVAGDRGASLAVTIIERADSDRDGVLSSEEAARAAERFVKQAELTEGGVLNEGLLRSALRRHIAPPSGMIVPLPPYGPTRGGPPPPRPAATSEPGPEAAPPRTRD